MKKINTDAGDTWLQNHKEREAYKEKMVSRLTSYIQSGKSLFEFDRDCYVYVENHYDERVNRIIERHIDEIHNVFQLYGFRFIYIPHWEPDKDLLSWAALDESGKKKIEDFLNSRKTIDYTRLLCKALQIEFSEIKNGIFHFAGYLYRGKFYTEVTDSKFTVYSLDKMDENNVADFFKEYCNFIVWGRKQPKGCYMSAIRKRHLKGAEWSEWEGDSQTELVDYKFPEDMKDIADDIKEKIEKLKDAGYYELLLHTLGSEMLDDLKSATLKPALSRLQITDDFKIFLSDYNKEIRLTPLQKTLFIFYLRHPEGVEFKCLSLYYDEMLAIYKVLSNRENGEKQCESIRRLVDPLDNAINEKCSRIKEAFLQVVDNFIARNYYITFYDQMVMEKDKSGCYYQERLKRITLPRHLVIYPKEIEQIKIINPKEEKERLHLQQRDEKNMFRQLEQEFQKRFVSRQKLIEQFTEFTKPPKLRYLAFFYRAILYTHIGKYEESIADSQVLIDHNVKIWSDALINKAEALYFLKRYDEALEEINKYEPLQDGEIEEEEFYLIRSKIYSKLKRKAEAKSDKMEYKRLAKKNKNRY